MVMPANWALCFMPVDSPTASKLGLCNSLPGVGSQKIGGIFRVKNNGEFAVCYFSISRNSIELLILKILGI